MNTNIKHLAAIAATAIWADGEYDEAEQIVLEEIAEAFEIDEKELKAEVESALQEIENQSEEAVDAYLNAHAAEVAEDETELVYMAAYLDPHTASELSMDEIKSLCDDLFIAHKDWLPEYI